MTVCIVQPNMTGHRPTYVDYLIRYAAQINLDVVVATNPGGRESYLSSRSIAEEVRADFICEQELKTFIKGEGKSDELVGILYPDGDRQAIRMLLMLRPPSAKTVLLIMRPSPQPRGKKAVTVIIGTARKVVFGLASRRQNVFVRFLESAATWNPKQERVVPDPIVISTAAKSYAPLSRARKPGARLTLGIFGLIDERKNVPLVIDAIARVQNRNPREGIGAVELRLAGAMAAGVRDYIGRLDAEKSIEIIVDDRHHTDEELDMQIAAVDIVVVAHSNEGPSGILGKALALGIPVLASGAVSLKRDLEQNNRHGIWVDLTPEALADGIRYLEHFPPPPPRELPGPAEFAKGLFDDLLNNV